MRANANSDEAKVWKTIAGKSALQQRLQQEFMVEFQQAGFGFVEGSKWTKHLNSSLMQNEESYKTRAQILKAECKDDQCTEAKIAFALSLGEGVPPPGDPKGWYKDPSRNNEPVYYYQENMKHLAQIGKEDARQTTNSSHPMAIDQVASQGFGRRQPMPITDGRQPMPITDGRLTPRESLSATPSPTVTAAASPSTPQTPTGTAGTAADANGNNGTPSTPQTPTGTAGKGEVKEEKTSPDDDAASEVRSHIEAAQLTLAKIANLPMLSGFKQVLQTAIDAVGVSPRKQPKSNWKSMKHLVKVTDLTNKVLALVDACDPN